VALLEYMKRGAPFKSPINGYKVRAKWKTPVKLLWQRLGGLCFDLAQHDANYLTPDSLYYGCSWSLVVF
jgi:hypothetical protein